MCGAPKMQTVTTKTELDPNLQRLLYGGIYQGPPAAPAPAAPSAPAMIGGGDGGGFGGGDTGMAYGAAPSGSLGGYSGLRDMFDGGGPGRSGGNFEGGGRLSDVANAVAGRGPEASRSRYAMGGAVMPQMGLASLNQGQMPMMNGGLPNLSDPMTAATLAMAMRNPQLQYGNIMAPPMGFAVGGYVEGPGTGTSDSVDAVIMQNGQPVQEALLSDGEFVMTERAVRGAGNGDRERGAARMYEMMRQFERGGRV
jgi:hypothetical protein